MYSFILMYLHGMVFSNVIEKFDIFDIFETFGEIYGAVVVCSHPNCHRQVGNS